MEQRCWLRMPTPAKRSYAKVSNGSRLTGTSIRLLASGTDGSLRGTLRPMQRPRGRSNCMPSHLRKMSRGSSSTAADSRSLPGRWGPHWRNSRPLLATSPGSPRLGTERKRVREDVINGKRMTRGLGGAGLAGRGVAVLRYQRPGGGGRGAQGKERK